MAESKLKQQDTYQGIYPTVFKKIDATDINVSPFQSYKTWTFTNSSPTSSIQILKGIYSDPNFLPALGTNLTYNDAVNNDGSLQTLTYFSINHFYYKYKTEPTKTFGPTDLSRTKKVLYESASVFSFPQRQIGDGIKPGSFKINGNFQASGIYGVGIYGNSIYGNAINSNVTIVSDRYGNLIHSEYPTASIISNVMWYEGFNEYFDTTRVAYSSANVSYIPGISYNSGSGSYGYQANFAGDGYIKTSIDGLYDRNHNYAISFFIKAENNTANSNIILTKSTSSLTPQFPFKIELTPNNYIDFTIAGSTSVKNNITSSIAMNSVERHILCQKSGSVMQLWIDGILHASASSTFLTDTNSPLVESARIDNADPVFIGGYETSGSGLVGNIDEIRIYNKALTSTEIGYLCDINSNLTFMQTNHVGNVFSKQGIAVISSPDYRFDYIVNNNFEISYRSTKTIHELSVIANVNSGDFNMSTNLTLTKDDDQTYKSFVSSSSFSPYITTIGLYDGNGQLLAVGKLAQPIRKLTDVDMNLLVRIDLDRNIS